MWVPMLAIGVQLLAMVAASDPASPRARGRSDMLETPAPASTLAGQTSLWDPNTHSRSRRQSNGPGTPDIDHYYEGSKVIFTWSDIAAGVQYRTQTKTKYKACPADHPGQSWSSWSEWHTFTLSSWPELEKKPYSLLSCRVEAWSLGSGYGPTALDTAEVTQTVAGVAVTSLTCSGQYPTTCFVQLETTCEKANGPGLCVLFELREKETKKLILTWKYPATELNTQGRVIVSLPNNLTANTRYTVTAYPANDVGKNNNAALSKMEEFIFLPREPSPVTDLRNPTVTQTSLTVTWDDPVNPPRIITSYKVTLSLVEEQEGTEKVNLVDSKNVTVNTAQFTGLQEGQTYSVSLAACNSHGCSHPSTLPLWTLPEVPLVEGDLNLQSSTSTSVTVHLPSLSNPPGWQWLFLKSGDEIQSDEIKEEAVNLVKNQSLPPATPDNNSGNHIDNTNVKVGDSSERIVALIYQNIGHKRQDFTLGDNKIYYGYHNFPLEKNSTHWLVLVTEKIAGSHRELIASAPFSTL